MKLSEIIFLNDVIQKHRSIGAPVEMYMVAPPTVMMQIDLATPIFTGELGLPTASSSTLY